MINAKQIVTVCILGAGLGAAAYLMPHGKPAIVPDAIVEQGMLIEMESSMFWSHRAVAADALQFQKRACWALYGEHYKVAETGACYLPADCTSCVTHKGVARNAVIHDNAWVRVKAHGPDYDAMMRQDKLVFEMSVAARGATEAGRQAYDHTKRCERLTWRADAQCN